MWLARNKNNRIYIYFEKPYKFEEREEWLSRNGSYALPSVLLKNGLFPKIRWEDKEPTWKRFIRPEWEEDLPF